MGIITPVRDLPPPETRIFRIVCEEEEKSRLTGAPPLPASPLLPLLPTARWDAWAHL